MIHSFTANVQIHPSCPVALVCLKCPFKTDLHLRPLKGLHIRHSVYAGERGVISTVHNEFVAVKGVKRFR